MRDKEQDVLYDILMTKVDVRIGEWGLYNFYKMQVCHQFCTTCNQFILSNPTLHLENESSGQFKINIKCLGCFFFNLGCCLVVFR